MYYTSNFLFIYFLFISSSSHDLALLISLLQSSSHVSRLPRLPNSVTFLIRLLSIVNPLRCSPGHHISLVMAFLNCDLQSWGLSYFIEPFQIGVQLIPVFLQQLKIINGSIQVRVKMLPLDELRRATLRTAIWRQPRDTWVHFSSSHNTQYQIAGRDVIYADGR